MPNTGGAPDLGYSNMGTGQAPVFQPYNFSLPLSSTANVMVRFQFLTGDSSYNGFRGLAVDEVSIDTTSSLPTATFEGSQDGWTFDPIAGPGAPFWHVVDTPENIFVKSPEINADLVTLSDSGALPPAPDGTGVAWFGDNTSGTFCGPDYANRFTQPPQNPPVIPNPPPFNPVDTLAELPNPSLGKQLNVQRLSGVVLIGIPAGAAGSANGRGARASQKGIKFVPLSQVRRIPVGSILNTRKGSVRIQSARNKRGARQNGDFAKGLFQVLQSRKTQGQGPDRGAPEGLQLQVLQSRARAAAPTRRPHAGSAACVRTPAGASAPAGAMPPPPSAARSGR